MVPSYATHYTFDRHITEEKTRHYWVESQATVQTIPSIQK